MPSVRSLVDLEQLLHAGRAADRVARLGGRRAVRPELTYLDAAVEAIVVDDRSGSPPGLVEIVRALGSTFAAARQI
jgi:hypothetical protein